MLIYLGSNSMDFSYAAELYLLTPRFKFEPTDSNFKIKKGFDESVSQI